jgi:hypothetical protein
MVEGVGRAAGEPDGNIFLPRVLFDLAVLSEENKPRFVFAFGVSLVLSVPYDIGVGISCS